VDFPSGIEGLSSQPDGRVEDQLLIRIIHEKTLDSQMFATKLRSTRSISKTYNTQMDHQTTTKSFSAPAYVDFATAIPDFKTSVSQLIHDAWEQEDTQAHFQSLADGLESIVGDLQVIGKFAAFEVSEESNDFVPWLLTYEWINNAKSFLLLWRDIIFEEQRAWLKVSTGDAEIKHFELLKSETKVSITKAAELMFSSIEPLASHPLNNIKQLERWQLEDNPWPIYKEQFQQLADQGKEMILQAKKMWNASGTFVMIGSHFTDAYELGLSEIIEVKKKLQDLLQKAEKDEISNTLLIEELGQIYSVWKKQKKSESFQYQLDDYISRLPGSEKIVVDTQEGLLLYKELNLRSKVRSWLESELISEVHSFFAIQKGITNNIHLNTISIKNLLLIEEEEEEEDQKIINKETIIQILTNFIKSLDRSSKQAREMRAAAVSKIREDYNLYKVYKPDFLAQSLQYTINQYRDSTRWGEFRIWLNKQGAKLMQLQRNAWLNDALSISERIVRVVNNRTPDKNNSHYYNMFLTKGWIGDSFTIGRESELSRVATIIDNWKLGFRGAIMLTGTRFSGKTLFGELIQDRFFRHTTIQLAPNTRCIIPGKNQRYFDLSTDLNAALKNIIPFCKREQYMVWIDDLENWQSDEISLAENISKLLNFVDTYSTRLFFVVSTSNWMKAQLSTAFSIDKVFQSTINIGSMSTENIRDAILVRHSATHTVLYDADEEEVSPAQLTRSINRICQVSEGNIGESLQRWAYTVTKIGEENIRLPKKVFYKIPPFLSTESALLLQSIIMNRKSSEKQLRKLFGPAYKQTYKPVVKRMLHLGILKEEQGKVIMINRFLTNEIGKLLSKKIEFTYSNQTNSSKKIEL